MVLKIQGDAPFQVLSHSFGVSNSGQGYDLMYSADGVDFSTYEEAVPSDETLFVNGVPFGSFFKLDGNTDEVTVIY